MALGRSGGGGESKYSYWQILDPKTLSRWRMQNTELELLRKPWEAPVSERAVGRSTPSAREKPWGAYI